MANVDIFAAIFLTGLGAFIGAAVGAAIEKKINGIGAKIGGVCGAIITIIILAAP